MLCAFPVAPPCLFSSRGLAKPIQKQYQTKGFGALRAPNIVVWYLFCIGFVVCRFCNRCCFVLFLYFWLLAAPTGLSVARENIRTNQRRPNLWPTALTFLGILQRRPCETTQQHRGPLRVSALTWFAHGERPDDTKNAGWFADQSQFWIHQKQGFGAPRNQPIKPKNTRHGGLSSSRQSAICSNAS